MAKPVIYGIANCDTVKKARKWLEKSGIDYTFHDFRKDGLDQKRLNEWYKNTSWENLLNKRSRTWRELSESDKTDVTQSKASKLILAQPNLIKRPVLEFNKQVTIGFDENIYKALFSS